MRTLMPAVKSALLAYRKRPEGSFLNPIQTWKLGILSAATVFPAVAILPDYDQIVRWYSGRRAIVERGFIISYYEKGVNAQALDQRVNEMMEKICDLLLKVRHLKNPNTGQAQVYDLTVGNINMGTVSDIPISSCTATFAVRSEEDFSGFGEDTFKYGMVGDLNEAIYKKLVARSQDSLSVFSSVVHGAIDDSTVLHYPAVLMKEIAEQPDTRVYAGVNKKPVNYIFNVCVRGTSDDRIIYQLFEATDAVREVLIQSEKWNGLAMNSEVGRIEYLQDRLKDAPIYVAQIPYSVDMVRQTTFVGE